MVKADEQFREWDRILRKHQSIIAFFNTLGEANLVLIKFEPVVMVSLYNAIITGQTRISVDNPVIS